jgi:hypothetical protein
VEKKLLVETQLTSLEVDGYDIVLKHRPIPFETYPYEWCAEMLKDAAVMVIDLEIELEKHGLTLHDPHSWNVLFDAFKPVYVDFGSIEPARSGPHENVLWPGHDNFRRYFVNPLRLMADGHERIARSLLHDFVVGVLDSDLMASTHRSSLSPKARRVVMRLLSVAKRMGATVPPIVKVAAFLKAKRHVPSRQAFLQKVRREVEALTMPSPKEGSSEYYKDCFPSFSPSDEWTTKHHSVRQALLDSRPGSVLDIGSNVGWYSQLAALLGCRVVAIDSDEGCVAQLYRDTKEKNLPILPLVMDFRAPSPGCGLSNLAALPATARLKCDMVMALALVHHLVFKQDLNFEQIIAGLSAFSARRLLVEFIPREDVYVRDWWSERYSWYNLENFVAVLKRHFHRVEYYPSFPDPRVLLLCEKKGTNPNMFPLGIAACQGARSER